MAFAAGAGIILTPNTMMPMAALNFLSPDGKSFSFDARANGYGRGEGVGFVVLKRLSDALRDSDPIRAVIRGTHICQDGRTPGIAYPSKAAQVANITCVYAKSGLGFDQTAYVECHAGRSSDSPLVVGSVKPNIGHLEGAAGVAGLIKAVLVPTKSCQWPLRGLRRVSVNCFGFGGTNAHAILDEGEFYLKQHLPPGTGMPQNLKEAVDLQCEEELDIPSPQLFTFTSPDQHGLIRVMHQYAEHILDNPNFSTVQGLDNLAYTLNCRRSQFSWKGFVVANTQEKLAEELNAVETESIIQSKARPDVKVAFLFGGQGAQFARMGIELSRFGVFRESIETATQYLREVLGSRFNLTYEIMKPHDESSVQRPYISQSATTAIQIGLVDLMKACGVNPSSAVGHSSGEIAAAYACGMISREQAWTIAFHRGGCADRLSTRSDPRYRGLMCAVAMSAADMRSYLIQEDMTDTIQMACINSPRSVTVSGNESRVLDMAADLKKRHVFHRILEVQVAYHSKHMRSIDWEYKACLQDLPMEFFVADAPMFSSVTGGRMNLGVQASDYWTDNLVSPVLFAAATETMVQETRPDILLELGPHSALKTYVAEILDEMRSAGRTKLAPKYISAMIRGTDEARSVLSALGSLWSHGYAVEMEGLVKKHKTYGILETLHGLPSYPWDHSKQYWHESPLTTAYRFRAHGRQDLLGEPTADSMPTEPRWRGFLRIYENPWIKDHQVQKTIIYPAAGIIAMVVEGIRQHALDKADEIVGFEITDMTIEAPLIVPEDRYGLETSLNANQLFQKWHPCRGMSFSWTIYARVEKGSWTRHAHGEVHCQMQTGFESDQGPFPSCEREFRAAELASTESINPEHLYEMLDTVGMSYGPTFRNITSVSKGEKASVGRVRIPDTKSIMPHKFEFDYIVHPATLDAMFQLLLAIDSAPMVPTTIESIYISTQAPKTPGTTLVGYANVTVGGIRGVDARASITAGDWAQPMVVVKGLHLNALAYSGFLPSHHNLCTEIRWQELFGTASTSRFSDLLQLVAHKYPGLSVLQFEGNVHMAKHVLDILSTPGGHVPRLQRYSLTGFNEVDFVSLRDAYNDSPVQHLLERRALCGNVENDPKYHLIISAAGGRDHDYLLTLLHPDGLLLETGREGSSMENDHVVPGDGIHRVVLTYAVGGRLATDQLSVTRAHQDIIDGFDSEVLIVMSDVPDGNLYSLAKGLENSFHQQGLHPSILTLQQACSRNPVKEPRGTIICLLDLNHSTEGLSPFVWSWTEEQYESFKIMRNLAKAVLWVTRGANKKTTLPKNAPIIGLARTLISEDPEKTFVTLDLDEASWVASPSVIRNITQVHSRSVLQSPPDSLPRETEYAESIGKLFIPRLVPITALNSFIQDNNVNTHPRILPFLDGHRNELVVKRPGEADGDACHNFRFIRSCPPCDPKCAPDKVRVKFRESFLQHNDWQTMDGATKDSTIGIDLFGSVTNVGSNVNDIKPNNLVVAVVPGGTLKSIHDIDQRFVKLAPFGTAGLQKFIPSAWIQAYYGLMMRCLITKDHKVLVHHGSSVPGQVALQIARFLGAEVYTTIGGNNINGQRATLANHFSIGPNHVYNSDDPNWYLQMLNDNDQNRMDVVYNPGPRNLCDMQHILKDTGTSIRFANNLASGPYRLYKDSPSSSIIRLDLAALLVKEPALVADIFSRVMAYIHGHDNLINPNFWVSSCDLAHLPLALAAVRDSEQCGGTCVYANGITFVLLPPFCQNRRLRQALDGGTYVIAGGVGGLGRSIAGRLVDNGAKNLVLLSRTKPSSPEVLDFITTLHNKGAIVLHIAVDICDAEAVKKAYSDISASKMPAISGIVQAAGVLRDSLFDNMSFEDWTKAMEPKTLGSSNLVRHFGQSLDPIKPPWFVFLSSSAGIIGNRGQANYAAGNVYMDALARSGKILGRAYSLDIGPILAAGMATDSVETLRTLRASGFYGIRLEDFLKIFERAVVGEIHHDVLMPSQVVLGVGTGGLILQNKPVDPYWARTAAYSYMKLLDMPPPDLKVANESVTGSLKSKLAACQDLAEATALICRALKEEMLSKATVGADEMDEGKPMKEYGVDSLMAVQIRVWALDSVGACLSIFNILSDKTILELSEEMAREVTGLV
ncbi:hypothetical protein ACHAQH_003970 [Verticillium albo-atrum]